MSVHEKDMLKMLETEKKQCEREINDFTSLMTSGALLDSRDCDNVQVCISDAQQRLETISKKIDEINETKNDLAKVAAFIDLTADENIENWELYKRY